MCKVIVSDEHVSLDKLDTTEVKALYNMINNAGLVERRIFNNLKNELKKLI